MTFDVTRQNHYVPIWYQKGFVLEPRTSLYYLDLDPPKISLPDGRFKVLPDLKPKAPRSCFWELDLYTTRFGSVINDEIERYLFGRIDDDGARAVRALAGDDARNIHHYFERLFEYLSAQKLRTPKGLDWIKSKYPELTQLDLMVEMQALRQMHCTMWLECVREILSAEHSDVKFIVTDHPITVYNAGCDPSLPGCRYPEDPSIALNGSQTVFPLDADHCLVLTNLEYARDPEGVDPLTMRQNARFYGETIARTDAWIRTRKLDRNQVGFVNHVLKARARRFVGAGEESWLRPPGDTARFWPESGKVLRPPANGLWHFGGEIYIGYKDGSVDYRDEFGRSTPDHEHLQKDSVPSGLAPNDPCGCSSGRKYKRCCEPIPERERPSWKVWSIRDRNMTLVNAVLDITGLNRGKSWGDVRRDLSDQQVSRIHGLYGALWPRDTNIMELLPRPDGRCLRALYMGFIDARTIASSVTSWLLYFDEIVIVNPFINPAFKKREYSPVESPGQYKEQTLKNVALLTTLAPFIAEGVVHMIPEQAEFDPAFRQSVWAMAKDRTANWKPTQEDMADYRRLAEDDFARSLRRLPDEVLRGMVRRFSPDLDGPMLDGVVQYMKEQHAKDPFALLLPMPSGEEGAQVMVSRTFNVELALFLAQLTGSCIYTDSPGFWKQIHEHASTASELLIPAEWAPVAEALRVAEFALEINPQFNFGMRRSGKLYYLRRALRQIWNAVCARGDAPTPAAIAEQLAGDVRAADESMRGAWATGDRPAGPSGTLRCELEISIPSGGFGRNAVRRLLIMSGRSDYSAAVPMALLARPRSDDQDQRATPA
jgi:hypothetical protein